MFDYIHNVTNCFHNFQASKSDHKLHTVVCLTIFEVITTILIDGVPRPHTQHSKL